MTDGWLWIHDVKWNRWFLNHGGKSVGSVEIDLCDRWIVLDHSDDPALSSLHLANTRGAAMRWAEQHFIPTITQLALMGRQLPVQPLRRT